MAAFRRHPGLRDQLERAALSVSNNVAEGFERGSTKELVAFLYIARGSAGEVRSMLFVLEGIHAFENLTSHMTDLKRRCENISKQLYGWIETLKNSDIAGQRHLDEKARTRSSIQKKQSDFLEELRTLRDSSIKNKDE